MSNGVTYLCFEAPVPRDARFSSAGEGGCVYVIERGYGHCLWYYWLGCSDGVPEWRDFRDWHVEVHAPVAPFPAQKHSGRSCTAWVILLLVLISLVAAVCLLQRWGVIRRVCLEREKVKKKMEDLIAPAIAAVRPCRIPTLPVPALEMRQPEPEAPATREQAEEFPSESVEGSSEERVHAVSAKVGWNDFLDSFKKRGAHEPFPVIEVGTEFSRESVDALVSDPNLGIRTLLEQCRDGGKRREIACEFLERTPKPGPGWMSASVLLTAEADVTYWVVGDIHATVSAIAKVCAVIAERHRQGRTRARNLLILLGDYIDRGNEPLETLAFIESVKMNPLFEGLEVVTLKGNHDVGLSRNAEGRFASMVSPSETADFLQACADDGKDVSSEAEAAMRLAAVSSRMCELTGIDSDNKSRTMMFVHGGVPHVDLQERLYSACGGIEQNCPFFKALSGDVVPEDLRQACAEDFTWIRLSKDLPVKRPNRGSRGCEIGTEDVAQYLFLHRVLTARDVTFLFRGHDHERPGFACYSPHPVLNPTKKKFAQRECNVLTLNTMEPDGSSGGMFRERDLAFAEWSLGEPVRLHRIATRHLDETPSGVPPCVRPEDLMGGVL